MTCLRKDFLFVESELKREQLATVYIILRFIADQALDYSLSAIIPVSNKVQDAGNTARGGNQAINYSK